MSSIYKKGRDGYFYYQAYLLNPKTGKKDKRVFHSLGTKNKEEAEKKQKQFDLEYDKNYFNENKFFWRRFKIPLFVLILIILFGLYFSLTGKSEKTKDVILESPISIVELNFDIPTDTLKNNESIGDNFLNKEIINIKKIETDINKNSKKIEIEVPIFNLIRIENIASTFSQGKIYITVDKEYPQESLLLLCQELRNRYKNFKNIIICIYLDNKVGTQLAKGIRSEITIEEKNEAWIVLYTYNRVEGE